MSYTATDLFCGAGGSSSGLKRAGFNVLLAANHWRIAIETHLANFPNTEHICADINGYDMRRLPTTDILWASPICTEMSPAGGRKRKHLNAQPELFGDGRKPKKPNLAADRTRATAYDVIRATEVHRYKFVLCENVVEFSSDWELFDWWLMGMSILGYNHQIVSVSSAHIGGPGNPYAPQWRDRLYVVFSRKDMRLPDVAPRPLSWCDHCGAAVHGVQSWRTPTKKQRNHPRYNPERRVGKYGSQYDYYCPEWRSHPKTPLVEPFVRPAADAINWNDLGEPVFERKRPLVPNTIARIESGLAMLAEWQKYTTPAVVTINHGADGGPRTLPVDGGPLPTRTVKIGEGLVIPGMLTPAGGSWNDSSSAVDEPMRTRLVRESEGLVSLPFVAAMRNHGMSNPAVTDPLVTVAAGGNHHGLVVPDARIREAVGGRPFDQEMHTLVIPFRKSRVRHVREPLPTLGTRDSAGIAVADHEVVDIAKCRFRMLNAREQLNAQRFPDDYVMHGSKTQQTKQAGNAVSSNVAQWLAERVMDVLSAA